jgi:hypothetical protein
MTRGQCSTTDRSRQRRMNHSVTASRRPSVRANDSSRTPLAAIQARSSGG